MAAPAPAIDNEAIVLDGLRESDRDRYLAVLLSPAEKRASLAALYQFHAELARVRDVVHEPLPGEIRLQYWRDLLEGSAHGSSDANPLAAELLHTIRDEKLPVEPLIAMAEARIFDLYDDPMETVASFEGYAGETASALIQLAGLVLDPEAAMAHAAAAGHAGVAQSIAGHILLLQTHRQRGQVFIPSEILKATGLDRDAFLSDTNRERIVAAVEAFAGMGLDHLAKVDTSGAGIAASIMPAFLPAAQARSVLEKAARRGGLALDNALRAPQWRRQLAMTIALWRRRI